MVDSLIAAKILNTNTYALFESWQLKIPIYGWLCSMADHIPIDKSNKINFENLSLEVRKRIKNGGSIVGFPEGERTLDGKIAPFKKGLFILSKRHNTPIVPIVITGLYDINHRGSYLFSPGTVTVFIGPQIHLSKYKKTDLYKEINLIRDAMVNYQKTNQWTYCPTQRVV